MVGEEDLPLDFGFLLAPHSGERKHARHVSALIKSKSVVMEEIELNPAFKKAATKWVNHFKRMPPARNSLGLRVMKLRI